MSPAAELEILFRGGAAQRVRFAMMHLEPAPLVTPQPAFINEGATASIARPNSATSTDGNIPSRSRAQ